MLVILLIAVGFCALPQNDDIGTPYRVPAQQRYAQIGGRGTILPGGRVIQPLGRQVDTGAETFGLSVSPKGTVATADFGPIQFGITLIDHVKWTIEHVLFRTPVDSESKNLYVGFVFETENLLWISEGKAGKAGLIDTRVGNVAREVNLNQGEWKNSVTGDLAVDSPRHLLFVLDRGNSRLAVFDTKKGQLLSSTKIGGILFRSPLRSKTISCI